MSIAGKAAIVTGSTRGIGLRIAEALLQKDARVMICARKQEDVERAVNQLQAEHGERVRGTVCDVRSYEQVRSLVREADGAFGGLDILVNNAGIGSHSHVEQM